MQRVAKTRGYAFIEEVSIALFLFDLLLIKNRNLLGVPLSERRRLLENCIKPLRLIRLSNYTVSSILPALSATFGKLLAMEPKAS
jgi:ATP-dependent DNA ligase